MAIKQGTVIDTSVEVFQEGPRPFVVSKDKRGYHTYRTEPMYVRFYNLHEARAYKPKKGKPSDPTYDITLVADGDVAGRMSDRIDEFRRQHAEASGAKSNKNRLVLADLDENDEETGLTRFKLKVPATWPKGGSRQPIIVDASGEVVFDPYDSKRFPVVDGEGNSLIPTAFGGSLVIVSFQLRDYTGETDDGPRSGVRLEPVSCQILKQGTPSSQMVGYGPSEEGYDEPEHDAPTGEGSGGEV